MILKAEEYIVEFKQKLVQDKIFEIPTYMQDLQYILKGLIGIFENQSQISENFRKILSQFIEKVVANTEESFAEKLIDHLKPKTIALLRDFYSECVNLFKGK